MNGPVTIRIQEDDVRGIRQPEALIASSAEPLVTLPYDDRSCGVGNRRGVINRSIVHHDRLD